MRFRNFCFTTFNLDLNHSVLALDDDIRYLVLQKEKCPTSNREHYQGYCELSNQKRLSTIKDLFDDNTMHVEKRRGTAQEASNYCKKVESRIDGPWEYGTISSPGRRTDIHAAVEELKANGLRAVRNNHPVAFVKYYRGFQEMLKFENPPERPGTRIVIFYGPPGTGKSWSARHMFPNAAHVNDNKHGWFDGYTDQKELIIDEFTCQMPLDLMLKLCESTPLRVPVKGSFVPMLASTIVLTTNLNPDELYPLSVAFQSRIHAYGEIFHMVTQRRGIVLPPTSESGSSSD